ncbi:ABC transporter permease [Lactococcus insecticola]|uniref:ABC transporter permease n=1 Tax=Pseudolactococcus insecticola TaxID=2709158 RepID=A0A6A0B7Y4_9LACT|nr:ABC transporter permease [Lactococcus insecticola]GFH40578.1 ABC transporter permease [Lactococcus insecticola]
MKTLFDTRKAKWRAQNLRYLRFVFNDHFVLVLMFLIGFLAYQYAAVIKTLPEHWLPGIILAVLISIMGLFFGRLATFVEPADEQFLLAKEAAVQSHLKRSAKSSLVMPAILLVFLAVILSPLAQVSLPVSIIWALCLVAIKYGLLVRKSQTFIKNNLIDWSQLISYETARQNTILKIFSQFTDVKGLRQSAKRRKYLDGFLGKTTKAYDYLFIRTFLRSGDYFALTLRLTGLAVLSLVFIGNGVLALLLAVLFDYLLVFQLLPLGQSQDYQVLVSLYPSTHADKMRAAQGVIKRLILSVSAIELVLGLIRFDDKVLAVAFVFTGLFLGFVYPKLKLK